MNLPKPVKVALRTKNKIVKSSNELLKWTEDLNPGLHTESWRVLDRQHEPERKFILLIDHEFHKTIKETEQKF
jgi:hypothetical protein